MATKAKGEVEAPHILDQGSCIVTLTSRSL